MSTENDNIELDENTDNQDPSSEAEAAYLEMDDEEFSKLSAELLTGEGAAPVAQDKPDEVEDKSEPNADESEDEDEQEQSLDTAKKPTEGDADSDQTGEGEESEEEASAPVNYEDNWKKITAPFNANGKEMQIDDPDDVRRLMQMGANYNKKMAAMKPGLKALKMLENNGLLDDDKLSFLIDVHKKDPGAIAKLLKDGNVSPLDIDEDVADEYKPKSHAVDDSTIELDSVLEELENSPHFNTLINTVTKEWDANSKEVIATNPQLLTVLDGHMASGVYSLISTALDRQRTLGHHRNLSDLEAYQKVGDELNAKGAFDHLYQNKGNDQASAPKRTSQPAKPKDDKAIKDKKRAASSPNSAPASKSAPNELNPLAMSDEDFSKQISTKFL